MLRIQSVDNLFHEGNPSTGEKGTKVTADFMNDVQEEVCNVIEAAGITLAAGNRDQLLEALRVLTMPKIANIAALRLITGSASLTAIETQGYYTAGDGGGNSFVWNPTSEQSDDGGSVVLPTGHAGAGRWCAVWADSSCDVRQWGAVGDGSTDDTAAMNKAFSGGLRRVHIPSGAYLIKGTLYYQDGLTVTSDGTLLMVSDNDYVVGGDGTYITNEAVLIPPVAFDTYCVDLQLKIQFNRTDDTGPWYPARFFGLRNSRIDFDIVCTSSGTSTKICNVDFYRDNRNVIMCGSYVTQQRLTVHPGGLWIRDISVDDTSYSQISVLDGTYIFNDGADESIAFFTQLNGKLRGCSIGAATVVGCGIGMGIVNLVGDAVAATDFDVSVTGTRVYVTALREGQAAVKFTKANPTVTDLRVVVSGLAGDTGASFYAGIRATEGRADGLLPNLFGCTVTWNMATQPTSNVILFYGKMVLNNCYPKIMGVGLPHYAARGAYEINGGNWEVGATVYDLSDIVFLRCFRPSGMTFDNVTYRYGSEKYGILSPTTDSNGQIVITHDLYDNPRYMDAKILNNTLYGIDLLSYTSTTFTVRVYNKSTNASVASSPVSLIWRAAA
jgi:hypothetical protein